MPSKQCQNIVPSESPRRQNTSPYFHEKGFATPASNLGAPVSEEFIVVLLVSCRGLKRSADPWKDGAPLSMQKLFMRAHRAGDHACMLRFRLHSRGVRVCELGQGLAVRARHLLAVQTVSAGAEKQ